MTLANKLANVGEIPRLDAITLACIYDPMEPFGHRTCIKALNLLAPIVNGKKICLLDIDGHGANFYSAYKEIFGNDATYVDVGPMMYRRRTNGPEENYSDVTHDYVILLVGPAQYYFLVRFVADHFATEPTLILPFVRTGDLSDKVSRAAVTLGDNRPIIAATYPGAGTKRLIPVLTSLLWVYGYERYNTVPVDFNTRYIASHVDPSGQLKGMNLSQDRIFRGGAAEHYYASMVSLLDTSMWVEFHQAIRTEFLASFEGVNSIYLHRDPRDIITTSYHRMKFDTGDGGYDVIKKMSKDELILQLIEGFEYIHPQRDYYSQAMSLAETAENFCAIKTYDNVYGLRYEDIRYRPRRAYRDLLCWLGLDGVNLVDFSDSLLDDIIETGTFEYQSNGKIKEGREAEHIFDDGTPIISRGLRRGISGDWKNHFSPAVKERCKEVAGEALIELGYEDNNDW